MKLTQLQQETIRSFARADLRTNDQMLALLLAEGFRFFFIDREPYTKCGLSSADAEDLILNELREGLNNVY
jgi:hypothetical protein